MPIFNLTLHRTYYNKGFFNITVDFDRFVKAEEGKVSLRLGLTGNEIPAKINRKANLNGTPRIIGGAKLRDWFQENFKQMEVVSVDLTSHEILVLEKQTAG